MDVLHEFRVYLTKPHVRPWALAAPILVLLFCIPLLRPLRHPDPTQMSDDELARLATVQSIVEHQTLDIDHSSFAPNHSVVRVGKKLYADQPPTFALLMAGPYWVMDKLGLDFRKNINLVEFFLTLIGVTIPVAIASGLIYRMGRVFVMSRWKRCALSLIVAFGSGLVSYAVVLNAHAPAAALVIGAAACLAHIVHSRRPAITGGWLAICGLCAGLAATIEPAAVLFTILLAAVIPAMRWRPAMRVAGVFMYVIGLAPPLLLHAVLTVPVTGDLRPINWHPELHARVDLKTEIAPQLDDEENSRVAYVVEQVRRLSDGLIGEHGVLSHFPVLLLGVLGIFAVMHRHWPATVKIMAGATGIAAGVTIWTFCIGTHFGPGSMFAAPHFVVFVPLLLFWAGAWLRRNHHPITWSVAGVLLVFSMSVSLVGATDPFPRRGYDKYSAIQALNKFVHPDAAPRATVYAGD
ncbi:MAG TPA: hypothetical protein VF669_03660 [Tepidisphaeraceae bacterium]|jgi:hypothetical protein